MPHGRSSDYALMQRGAETANLGIAESGVWGSAQGFIDCGLHPEISNSGSIRIPDPSSRGGDSAGLVYSLLIATVHAHAGHLHIWNRSSLPCLQLQRRSQQVLQGGKRASE